MLKIAGKKYIFVRRKDGEQDSGILPASGKSNDFAVWNPDKRAVLGGSWVSRRFRNDHQRKSGKDARKGLGKTGLLGRFIRVIGQSRYDCKQRKNGKPISDSPADMLSIWLSQKGKCICGSRLEVLKAVVDHNHSTGKVRAFLHPTCNVVEGLLGKKSKTEIKKLLEWFWSTR